MWFEKLRNYVQRNQKIAKILDDIFYQSLRDADKAIEEDNKGLAREILLFAREILRKTGYRGFEYQNRTHSEGVLKYAEKFTVRSRKSA